MQQALLHAGEEQPALPQGAPPHSIRRATAGVAAASAAVAAGSDSSGVSSVVSDGLAALAAAAAAQDADGGESSPLVQRQPRAMRQATAVRAQVAASQQRQYQRIEGQSRRHGEAKTLQHGRWCI